MNSCWAFAVLSFVESGFREWGRYLLCNRPDSIELLTAERLCCCTMSKDDIWKEAGMVRIAVKKILKKDGIWKEGYMTSAAGLQKFGAVCNRNEI